jgi:signal transduction histidine kinase/ActR/RegA family two-component response regulator
MKSPSLSMRIILPTIVLSTIVTLALSAAVFALAYNRALQHEKQHFSEYVQMKAGEERRLFNDISSRNSVAASELKRQISRLSDGEAERRFDRYFPLQPDGTRRSIDALYVGGLSDGAAEIYGTAAFIPNGRQVPLDEKKLLVAAAAVVFDLGRAGMGYADNLYFFTPRGSLVIFAPRRPDRLMFYRHTAPPSFSIAAEELFQITLGKVNPGRVFRCTGLRRLVSDPDGKRLSTGCATPVDLAGQHVGAFGSTALLDGYLNSLVNDSQPGSSNILVTGDGKLVAHPGIRTPGEATPKAIAKYERQLDLAGLMTVIRAQGASTGVVETAARSDIVAYGRIDGPGWYFLILSPKAELTAATLKSTVLILVIALIAIGAQALAISWFLMREVVRPLETLASSGLETDDHRLEEATIRDDEIGELARSLAFERRANLEIHQTLERRVKERTLDLEDANAEKSRFLANMSHELRTPLNGVVAVVDLLVARLTDPVGLEYAGIIRSSAQLLERVVSDILDFSKIEAGQIDLDTRPFELGELVASVIKPFELSAHQKGLALEVKVADAVSGAFEGDELRLSQILVNLMSNALKFTHQGQIELRVVKCPEGVRFTVTDSGVGFDQEAQQRLFSRFMQADSSVTRQYGGSGLGLAICAELAGLMGGTITARSQVGVGSAFELTLPLRPVVLLDAPALPSPASLPQTPILRVLLAEDNPTNQRVVGLILGAAGISLCTVDNGREAVVAYSDQPFDVILMDMQMPEMDGLEAMRRIRALEASSGVKRTPIICVSANALPEHVEAARLAGADSHLAKPFRAQALLEALSLQMTQAALLKDPASAALS